MSENEYRGHTRHPYHFAWAILALLAVIATVTALSWAFFRPVAGTGPYYFYPFGGFFAIFWIIGIFWVVRMFFWGGRWGYYPRRYWRHHDEAYYILRGRYARGEITKDQYDQMMRDLQPSTN